MNLGCKTTSFVSRLQTMAKSCPAWLMCLFLCFWGMVLRILAARKAFPAQGDSSHFVQHGKEYVARGVDALSGYWSLLPQFLSGWSSEAGWMPQYVLQVTTVAFGIMLVAGVFALALELTRSRMVAFVAGWLIATNPVLTASATSGLAETPHMALATWTLVLVFSGVRKEQWWRFALAGVLASVDMYYRPYDLAMYLAGAAPFVLWRMRGIGWAKSLGMIVAALLAGGICSGPFFVITSMKSSGSVGTSKLSNLAYGADGLDAKAMYAAKGLHAEDTPFLKRIHELQADGPWKYIWRHRREISKRYVMNVMHGIRNVNDHVFAGMFRMGLFWFVSITLLCLAASKSDGNVFFALYALFTMGLIQGSLSLSFVHPRWNLQFLPFFMILLGLGCAWLLRRIYVRRIGLLAWCCLLVFGVMNSRFALQRLEDAWKQHNVFPVCERLHSIMGEDERLMCFHPELPALFYKTNALCWDNIPFDSVADVFSFAEAQGVDCIVLDDNIFPHFPIHEIERKPDLIPYPWKEIDRAEFEHETRFGLERNVFRFYRKTEDGATPRGGDLGAGSVMIGATEQMRG